MTQLYFAMLILALAGCAHTTQNRYESASTDQRSQFKRTILPLPAGTKFEISQGAFGKQSHLEMGNEYSWDFEVPYGTPVVSIEDGTVLEVWEPSQAGGCDKQFSNAAHNIKVQHDDGTVAQYVHISSRVAVGDKVREGQIIAMTAMNGWICKPQLHFGVYKSKYHLYSSPSRETVPLLFDGLPEPGLAIQGSAGTVPDGIVIKLVKDTPNAIEAKKLMETLLKKYDLSSYFFTTKIQIEPFVIPHSHPILTLNTRHNKEPDFLLSTFLHEQLHWFLSGPYEPLTQKAIKALKARYPKVPVGGKEGGTDEESTYLHLVVCWLELQADKRYLGDKRAYEIIRKTDHYTWVYKQVLDTEKEIGAIIERSGLSFRSARAVRSFAFPGKFHRSAWLQDFTQLEKMISGIYPNLEVSLSSNKLSPRRLDRETRSRLQNADSNLEAFLAIQDFIDKFKDGHLRLDLKKPDTSKTEEASLSNSTPGILACQKTMGAKQKNLNFLFPTSLELGFGTTQTHDNAIPTTVLNVSQKKVGFVRIASFGQGDYLDLCAEEWDKYRTTFKSVCDQKCQDKFVHQLLPNRLLSSFENTLTTLKSENISGLVLDLTNNGGGTDWVGAIMRILTDKTILCGQFGFIRHPHWSKNISEQIAELQDKLKVESDSPQKEKSLSKLKRLEADLKESQKRCDRSNVWSQDDFQPLCSLVIKRPVLDCSPSDDFKYNPGTYNGRLFVLVNDRTASASEDLVGRFKDSKIATIIGERTHGSGCGFTNGGIPLVLANSGIKVSISDCARFLRDGTNEVVGIKPDVEIPMYDLRADTFAERLKSYLSKALEQTK